jgi:hypothetical protein
MVIRHQVSGRIAAEKLLPVDQEKRKQVFRDLGDENSPTDDSTPGDGQGGDQPQDAPQGSALQTPEFQAQVKKEKEILKKELEKEQGIDSDKPKIDMNDFSQKSESTEGLFAGPTQYKTVQIGDKTSVVRPMVDPDTGKALDTSKPNDRQRAITILDERLNSLNDKAVSAVKFLEEGGTKTERTARLKWLGEVGELQAYKTLLESNKVKDTYLLTDSEMKNDLIIIGETQERELYLKGISVKTTKTGFVANTRGSSIKPDLAKAVENAETQTLNIEGVDDEVDGSVMINSLIELRKRFIKDLTTGNVRRHPENRAKTQVKWEGKWMSIAEFQRQGKITPQLINKIFDDDNIFPDNTNNPIRGLSKGENVEEPQRTQLRNYFKQQYIKMLGNKPYLTIQEMEEATLDKFINTFDSLGADIVPSADMMISYYEEKGFGENKIIPKEDSQKKIMEVLGVDNFSEIDRRTQFKTVLGLDFTGRGIDKDIPEKSHIDGQTFGRQDPRLAPEPKTMDDYIDKYVK